MWQRFLFLWKTLEQFCADLRIYNTPVYCIALTKNNVIPEWASVCVEGDMRSYSHRPRLIRKTLFQRDGLGSHSLGLHQDLALSALDRVCSMAVNCLKPTSRLILIVGTPAITMFCLKILNVTWQYLIFEY